MKFKPFDADAVIDAGCALLKLELLPEDRKGVRNQLKSAAKLASVVEQVPLDDRIEPGPVYRP